MPRTSMPGELKELSRQIRLLTKRCKRQEAAERDRGSRVGQVRQRCAPDSLVCLLVYILSNYVVELAADFVLGKGWKNGRVHCTGCDDVIAAVEWGYIRTPLDILLDLELEPLKLLSAAAVLAAAKYVLEHRLAAWVETQNRDHGVAPSRHLLVHHALTCVPNMVPREVRSRLLRQISGPVRKQRKFLASFRRRWGARYGRLRAEDVVGVEERRRKASGFKHSCTAGRVGLNHRPCALVLVTQA